MKINELFKKKSMVFSFEIFPPKTDAGYDSVVSAAEKIAALKPSFISVTYGAGGGTSKNTVNIASHIKGNFGVESLAHLTCVSSTKEDVHKVIGQMKEKGIENILALRGDRNPNIPEKHDFAHASDLVAYLKEYHDFCIAGACYPECHPDSANRVEEMRHLRVKVDAGAEVLLSQLFFDNNMFYRFVEDSRIAGIDVPITPGIMPVINGAQIQRMVTLCGASLPERFEKIIKRYGDNKQALFDAGMAYALSQIIDLLANDVDGLHLYTMNNPVVAKRICEGIKNLV